MGEEVGYVLELWSTMFSRTFLVCVYICLASAQRPYCTQWYTAVCSVIAVITAECMSA